MRQPAPAPTPPRAWRLLVLSSSALAALVLAATLVRLAGDLARGAWPTLGQGALFVVLALGAQLVLRSMLLFHWRGQRVALAPDELLVFVALVALPPTLVILFALPAMAIFQATTRRGWLRGAANVSVLLLATGTAVGVYELVGALGAVPALAATLAIAAYTVLNLAMVSAFFSLRENVDAFRVYRERFLVPTAFHVLVGVSSGLALVALWSYHPLAVLAVLPFAYFVREHVQLMARTDREAVVHQKLARVNHELVGEPDVERVASHVLQTCGDIFHAGRVTLTLATTPEAPARTWTRDYEGGVDVRIPPLAVVVPSAREMPLGAITVYPTRASRESFHDSDRALLQIVAGEAAVSIESARVLTDLEASKKELVHNRVARPLVKRIVRSLIEETRADRGVLTRLGRSLARDADAADVETLCAAYDEMGLGALRLATKKGAQYSFVGHDLFERHPGFHSTTCDMALGFLVGAVARERPACAPRGSELACQSRGDPECIFVVHAKPGGTEP